MADENNEQEQGFKIPLDGSFGLGALAELTVITRHGDKLKEETFTIPYSIIDVRRLDAFNSMNLINGYKLVKITESASLKDLGL